MRSSCGWETISMARAVQEGWGGISAGECFCLWETQFLGGQVQVFWQIFLGVSLSFNSDDAVKPLPSSCTALPPKLRWFVVHICPSHRLVVCLLPWDDQSGHLNADNPPDRKAVVSSHYLSLFPHNFPLTIAEVIRGAPQFSAAQNRWCFGNTQLFMKHHAEADACMWLCRVAGLTIAPGITLQQLWCAYCSPVFSPQPLVLVLVPPELEALS